MLSDIDEARRHHAALRELVARHPGGSADYRTLRRVLELCRCAAEALDDRYCLEKLRLVEDFAAEMLSHDAHHRWDVEAMTGAQFLKQQILGALELFNSRLYSLESLRRSTARAARAVSPTALRT
jgi:hypothetical protein